jgi:hypothetical protein
VGRGTPISPVALDLAGGDASWPFRQAAESGEGVEVDGLPERFGPLPGAAWPEPAERAVVLPMSKPGLGRPAGLVVAGVSPRRPEPAVLHWCRAGPAFTLRGARPSRATAHVTVTGNAPCRSLSS